MKIKAKKGYNVIINDLNISLSANGKSVIVDEEAFNNSIDAKQLSKFIEIINDDTDVSSSAASAPNINVQANKVSDQAFVIGTDNNKPIGNAVLMDPDNVIQQPIKKIAKVNDATVIQPVENKTAENKTTETKAEEKQEAVKPTDNSAATIVTTNAAKVVSTDPADASKQLTKKAKNDKNKNGANENKKDINENKKDVAKA